MTAYLLGLTAPLWATGLVLGVLALAGRLPRDDGRTDWASRNTRPRS